MNWLHRSRRGTPIPTRVVFHTVEKAGMVLVITAILYRLGEVAQAGGL